MAFMKVDTDVSETKLPLHITTDEPDPVNIRVESFFGSDVMGFENEHFPMTGVFSYGQTLMFMMPTPTLQGGSIAGDERDDEETR